MAKGGLTAVQMCDQIPGGSELITRDEAIKLARRFAKQEVMWWRKLVDKWEKAYHELQKITDG